MKDKTEILLENLFDSIINDDNCLIILFHQIVDFYFLGIHYKENISIKVAKDDLKYLINKPLRSMFEIHAVERSGNGWRWEIYIKLFSWEEFSDIHWIDLPTIETRAIVEWLIKNEMFNSIRNTSSLQKDVHFTAFKFNNYMNENNLKKQKKIKKNLFNKLFDLLNKYYPDNNRVNTLVQYCKEILE